VSSVPVQFLFDFGSPNAYLSHKVIPAIELRTGASFEYVPILLGGLFKLSNNRSPAEAFAAVPTKRAYDQLEARRFIAKHGLTRFRTNPFFPVNTLKIMRGAVAAQELGCFAPYVEAMFAAMWEQGLNMDDVGQIQAALKAANLDADALLAKTQDPAVKARLLANTQNAHERGAFGSPTFFVGEELFFGKDRLRDVEEEITRASAEGHPSNAP
jgi:2-hydroxychromene-2-carboxylate isomerase